jgi:AraC-like DNA-binding protein
MTAAFVAALVLDAGSRSRIRAAVGNQSEIRFCEHRDELLALAADTRGAIVLTEPRDRAGMAIAPCIRSLRQGFPSVPVVAYLANAAVESRDIVDLVRAGANQLVRYGFDDVGVALRAALSGAWIACTAQMVRGEITPLVPPRVSEIVDHCLDHAGQTLDVRALAAALAVDRRTLVRRLTEAGLPGPQELIGWCRLLLAARLLDDPGRPIEQIALALDFASAPAMRNMLYRYTGLRVYEVRQNGGFRCVLHLFKRALTRQDSLLSI